MNSDPESFSFNDLLARVRAGDRDAAATLGLRYAPEIRRRAHGALGYEVRRLLDSEDIVSTVLRRLDDYVKSGNVIAESEGELKALLVKICKNAVVDKVRMKERLKNREGKDSDFARIMLQTMEEGSQAADIEDAIDFGKYFKHLERKEDCRILYHWLQGHQLHHIATMTGLSEANTRKRWQRIRSKLLDAFAESKIK